MTEAHRTIEHQLSSEELNTAIGELETMFEKDMPNGKPIPYMGWFWRQVDFDDDSCCFGITADRVGERPWVAFMENNKWGYTSITCKGEEWTRVKELLQVAARERTLNSVRAAYDAIQAIGAHLKAAEIAQDQYGFDNTRWETA